MPNLRDYFQYKNHYIVSTDPARSLSYFREAVDLDQDGNKDLLLFGFTYPGGTGATDTPQASLFYWGAANGTYSLASASTITLPATTHPREIAYADFNKDGKHDIFLADHGWDTNPFPGGQNQLILSGPTGWSVKTENLPARKDFTHCTAVGDINNDGNVDIFLGNVDTSTAPFNASILFGDGTGRFVESTSAVPAEIRGPIRFYAAQLADLNNDGWVDLVIGNSGDTGNTKAQSIIYWNDKGSYSNTRSTLLPNGFFGARNEQILDIQAADFNGDGRKDLVLLSTQNNPFYDGWSLQVLSNQAEGFVDISAEAFGGEPAHMGAVRQATQSPWFPFVKLVDLNGDGTLDFLLPSIANAYRYRAPETIPLAYLNDGFAHYTPVTAGDLLDLQATYKDFFAGAVADAGANGLSWVDQYTYQGSIYFRELVQTRPLPKVSAITGTTSNDTVRGNELDNQMAGKGGNDILSGGEGSDTALMQGRLRDYKLSIKAGQGTVTDSVAARDGVDTLSGVEHVRFSDFDVNTGIRAVATSVSAETLQRVIELYVAFFNRTPDADGLSYWLGQARAGMRIDAIAEAFYEAGAQYTALTGFSSAMTNADFIHVVYRNVLGRQDGADAGGLAYWSDELESGRASRGTLVSTILDSAHTFKGHATWGWVANLLDNKVAVARQVAVDWGLNYLTPEASVSNGMAIARAVTPTDIAAAIALVGIPEGAIDLG